MRELHVVAISEDGRHVVLATRKGSTRGEFRVPLDDRLAAALRGELPRPGERTAPDVVLSPKEIQARLRAGESTEQIAASAGVPVARVERYAGPVLSEREGIITAARRAVLSRSRRGLSGLPLGEAIAQHLSGAAGYRPETATWSARREPSGRWVVQLSFVARAKTRTAAWRYDPATRELTPLDAGSAVLGHVEKTSGQRAAANPRPAAPTQTPTQSPASAARKPAARTSGENAPARKAAAKVPAERAGAAAKAPGGRAAAAAKAPAAQVLTVKRAAASGRLVPGRTVSAPGARRSAVVAATPTPLTPESSPAAADEATRTAAPTAATAGPAEEAPTTAPPVERASPTAEVAPPAAPAEVNAAESTPTAEGPSGPPLLRVVPPPTPSAPTLPAAQTGPAATAAPDPAAAPDPTAAPGPAVAPTAGSDRSSASEEAGDPDPASVPAPTARPARRAAGGRASVPAWADVLLGIAPVESARDRDRAQD